MHTETPIKPAGVAERAITRRSPLAFLSDFICRMAKARERHGDCGGSLEVEVLSDTAEEIRTEATVVAQEATWIDHGMAKLEQKFNDCLADKKSPGVIDRREAAGLRRDISGLQQSAADHERRTLAFVQEA